MKLHYLLPIILVILISGCTQYTSKTTTTAPVETSTQSETTPTQETQPTSPPETTTPTQTPSVKEFRIIITHGSGYSPNTFIVKKGDIVRFLATSDPVGHNHGITIDAYNIDVAVTKASTESPQLIEFVADKSGVFEIYCKPCLDGPLGAHPWIKGTLKAE